MRQKSQLTKLSLKRRLAQATLALGLAILALCVRSVAQQQIASDYQVEAAYLYNFAKLGQWPKQALPDGDPLVIGVVGGDDDFGKVLTNVVAGKAAGTHPVVVRRLTSSGDLRSCQVLFFRSSERKHVQETIANLGPGSILLVGEDKDFLQEGGIINLLMENGAIRFELDPDALERANIHFSPQVLAQAKIQHGGNPQAGGSRKIEVRSRRNIPNSRNR